MRTSVATSLRTSRATSRTIASTALMASPSAPASTGLGALQALHAESSQAALSTNGRAFIATRSCRAFCCESRWRFGHHACRSDVARGCSKNRRSRREAAIPAVIPARCSSRCRLGETTFPVDFLCSRSQGPPRTCRAPGPTPPRSSRSRRGHRPRSRGRRWWSRLFLPAKRARDRDTRSNRCSRPRTHRGHRFRGASTIHEDGTDLDTRCNLGVPRRVASERHPEASVDLSPISPSVR